MHASGPFCPVIFATCRREGLQTYTYRGLLTALPLGTLVNTTIHADDDADFHRRFINTQFRAPASTHYSAHG